MKCFAQDHNSLRVKVQNNQNPAKWDLELFEYDKVSLRTDQSKPMHWLAFPVESYDMGVFSNPFNFKSGDAIFSGVTFGVNLPTDNEDFNFDYYASLIFKTPDLVQISTDVISRNSPGVVLRGRIELGGTYDFIGIKQPDNTGTLFVGIKAFDLRFGSTIIIFPESDGSFSYLQLDDLPANVEDFDIYLERIRDNDKVVERLNYYNNHVQSDKK